MAPLPSPRPIAVRVATATAGVSWLALVASTTLGVDEVAPVRATVQGDAPEGDQPLRLVVQSYSERQLERGAPRGDARPTGATQRSVTREELRAGVEVSLVAYGGASGNVLVAWVEPGEPNLELDALSARPCAEALVGLGLARRGARGA